PCAFLRPPDFGAPARTASAVRALRGVSRGASAPRGGALPALAGLHPRPRPRRGCRRARTLLAGVRDRAAVPEAPGPHMGLARAPFAPADLRGGSLLRDRARRSRAAAPHAERARRSRRALEPYAGVFCSASSMR